jgi:hypothetical protein
MAAGKIVAGVIGARIETARLRPAEPTVCALQDVAAVLGIQQPMRGGLMAGRARKLQGNGRRHFLAFTRVIAAELGYI